MAGDENANSGEVHLAIPGKDTSHDQAVAAKQIGQIRDTRNVDGFAAQWAHTS